MSEEKKMEQELADGELDEVVGGQRGIYYYVKKGDKMQDIAAKFGTNVNQICLWNAISNPVFIKTGDRLRVG